MGIEQGCGVLLDIALDLARAGYAVFPFRLSRHDDRKIPACPHGLHDASTEPAEVTRLFTRYRADVIGVRTGDASGIAVLDIDPRHGGTAWLAAHGAHLPPTWHHQTRSGGRHIVFQHRPGLRNSVGQRGGIAPGVDVRAEGGCVVWWPSLGYPILSDAVLAAWPDWLVPPDPIAPVWRGPTGSVRMSRAAPRRRYALAALHYATRRVALAAEGCRNDTLNRETFALARFVAEHTLSIAEVSEAMLAGGYVAGLSRREIASTVKSAVTARLRQGSVARTG